MASKIFDAFSGNIDGKSVYLVWLTMDDGSRQQFFLYTGILSLNHDLISGVYGAKLLRTGGGITPYWDMDSHIAAVELESKIENFDPVVIF